MLLDLQQRRLRWRVLLVSRPENQPLVVIETIGKGVRVLHHCGALWCWPVHDEGLMVYAPARVS